MQSYIKKVREPQVQVRVNTTESKYEKITEEPKLELTKTPIVEEKVEDLKWLKQKELEEKPVKVKKVKKVRKTIEVN